MAKVQAARNSQEFRVLLDELERNHGLKARAIGELAAIWLLRISDLLAISFTQIKQALEKGEITIIESKTKKTKKLVVTISAFNVLERLIATKRGRDVLLFQSDTSSSVKPISRNTVLKWVKSTEKAILRYRRARGVIGGVNFGTHTFRKTGARARVLESNVQLPSIQKLLNHSSLETTMIYLDLDESDLVSAYSAADELFFVNNGEQF